MIGSRYLICSAVLATSFSIAYSFAKADDYYYRFRPTVITKDSGNSLSVQISGDREGVVGTPLLASIVSTPFSNTIQYSISSGSLPPGVSLDNNSGRVTGVPAKAGNYTATIVVRDATSTSSVLYSVTIYDPLEIDTSLQIYATVGKAYSASFKASGGDQHYSWKLLGSSPTWLNLFEKTPSDALLSGTPTSPGTWNDLRIALNDGANHSISTSAFSLSVADPLVISDNVPSAVRVGKPYSYAFTRAGGHEPINWSRQYGFLPEGISFNNGVISGTPTKVEKSNGIVFRATDASGEMVSTTPFSIDVIPSLSISTEPSIGTKEFAVNTAISYPSSVTTANVRGTLRYSLIADGVEANIGAYCSTLAFSEFTGKISGTATAYCDKTFSIRATDSFDGSFVDTNSFRFIVAAPVALSNGFATAATTDVLYSSSVTASGGSGSYTWNITNAPSWLSLTLSGPGNATATLSGTPPISSSTGEIVITVTDDHGLAAGQSLQITSTPASTPSEALISSIAIGGGKPDSVSGTPVGATTISATKSNDGVVLTAYNQSNNAITITYSVPVHGNSVDLSWYCLNNYGAYSFSYMIESSLDGASWTPRSSTSSFTYSPSTGCQYKRGVISTNNFTPAVGKYWRMRFTSMSAPGWIDQFRLK